MQLLAAHKAYLVVQRAMFHSIYVKLWQHVLDFGTYTPWSALYLIESRMQAVY
ncbi:hypothetical protein HanIR_Chr09g0440601 [Helianthus annuus]|nr:hypothetical protein HanIR_Chr09g0440601 [Helianthus annuus]